MFRLQLQVTLTIILVLGSSIGYSTLVQTQSSILVSQTPSSSPSASPTRQPRKPPPSPGPRPSRELNPDDRCRRTSKPLTALIPKDKPGLTTSGQPTFWFYVPYNPEEIRSVEFSLLTENDKRVIYRVELKLSKTPGIISISLPSQYTIEEGRYYHWYLEVYCQQSRSSQPSLYVDGWIERVALTPDRQRQIEAATSDIWYDSLTVLGNRRLASPQDEELKDKWRNLLRAVGWEDLTEEPLVGSVELPEK